MIRSTYNPLVRTAEMDILRPVMEADLLVLDDLGSEKTSEWVEETMNLIVNTRYNERRLTIFTSNYEDTPDDSRSRSRLKARIGFRIHSRLHEMCEFLEFDGADYRHQPPNGGPDDLLTHVEAQEGRRTAPQPAGQIQGPDPRASCVSRKPRPPGAASSGTGCRRRQRRGHADDSCMCRMLGLYLHIPFCSSICNYCNFNRGLFDAELKARYVDALGDRDPARGRRRRGRPTPSSSAAARRRCSSRTRSAG